MAERPRKSKVWNEMEKDLFLKGLELFGENWRKISKFIATKTLNQVKLYHKEWAKTANVVPDSANLVEDSCIYLRTDSSEREGFLISSYQESMGFMDEGLGRNPGVVVESNSLKDSLDALNSSSEADTDGSGLNVIVDGIVVSSLHDWNLGSQVSITDEDSPPEPLLGAGPLNIICGEGESTSTQVKKRKAPKEIVSKIKKEKHGGRSKGKSKKRFSAASKAKLKRGKKGVTPNAAVINEGEIIHLNKNDSESSDVDIDDSDRDEPTLLRTQNMNVTQGLTYFTDKKDFVTATEPVNGNATSVPYRDILGRKIPESEKLFYVETFNLEGEGNLSSYFSIRNEIVKEWEICRPLPLAKEKIVCKLKHVDSEVVNKIYDFLNLNDVINFSSSKGSVNVKKNPVRRVLPKRNRNALGKERLNSGRFTTEVIKKGGGITMSHDSSGAVIKTLHIPEASNRGSDPKKKSSLQPLKLLSCLTHDPDSPAPFSALIYPQAVVTLDLHSHSSYSEVIGLLGGFLDHSKHALHIIIAVPTKASSSKMECEMCPLSQMEAFEQISSSGMEVVGWYHSHPCFLPNPSQKDCDTQAQLQNWFKKRAAPFVGIILSPFCRSDDDASVIRCFILDSPPSKHAEDLRREFLDADVPFKIEWSVLDESELNWDEMRKMVESVLQKSKESSNPVKWKEEWKRDVSYMDKLILSLQLILPLNLREFVSVVRDCLVESMRGPTAAFDGELDLIKI